MPDPLIRWKQQYTSAALNRQLTGVLPPGVYQGYDVSLSQTADSVDVAPVDGLSAALVRRGEYLITLAATETVTIEVPATDALYHIIATADYSIGTPTTGRLDVVVDGSEASHHVIVGSVERSGGTLQAPTGQHREFIDIYLPNVLDKEQVVNQGGTPSILSGSSRPPAGTEGRLFVSTDELQLFRDTGSAWQRLGQEAFVKIKPSDETVTNSTTMQDDDDLFAQVDPSQVYLVEADLYFNDIPSRVDAEFSLPGTGTFIWHAVFSSEHRKSDNQMDAEVELGFSGNTKVNLLNEPFDLGPRHLHVTGRLSPDTTGTLAFRWTQSNARSDDLILKKGSALRLTRL